MTNTQNHLGRVFLKTLPNFLFLKMKKYPKLFINKKQSKEERRSKYKKLREAGFNCRMCRRARDWTNNHVNQIIKAFK